MRRIRSARVALAPMCTSSVPWGNDYRCFFPSKYAAVGVFSRHETKNQIGCEGSRSFFLVPGWSLFPQPSALLSPSWELSGVFFALFRASSPWARHFFSSTHLHTYIPRLCLLWTERNQPCVPQFRLLKLFNLVGGLILIACDAAAPDT